MAGLPTIRRIMREDFRDAPAWLDRLIYSLNIFFDSVYTALNKNLTFGANVRAQIKSFQITSGVLATNNVFNFAATIGSVQGVILLSAVQQTANYTPLAAAPVIASWRSADGMVYIDSITGLTSGQLYNITVLVI
jgi:hypothetical protein